MPQSSYYLNPKYYLSYYGGMKSGKTAIVKELFQKGIDTWDQKLAEHIFQTSKEDSIIGTYEGIIPSTFTFWKNQGVTNHPTNLTLMEFLLDT